MSHSCCVYFPTAFHRLFIVSDFLPVNGPVTIFPGLLNIPGPAVFPRNSQSAFFLLLLQGAYKLISVYISHFKEKRSRLHHVVPFIAHYTFFSCIISHVSIACAVNICIRLDYGKPFLHRDQHSCNPAFFCHHIAELNIV